MKFISSLILFLTFINLSAQTRFEKGYYITNNNEKIEGYIKNIDWKDNPNEIVFKTNKNDNSNTIDFKDFKEFSIDNSSKFIKYQIKVEKSSGKVKDINFSSEPNFVSEEVFLKVLVEGEKSLFVYNDNDLVKFFYGNFLENPTQLIYIQYYPNDDEIKSNQSLSSNVIMENNLYKKQLFENVNCNFEREKFSNLKYNTSSLTKHFKNYNECKATDYNIFKTNKTKLHIKPSVNINYYSFNLESYNGFQNAYSNKEIGFGFGFEFEAVLPYNNGRFSIVIDPSYNIFEANTVQKGTRSAVMKLNNLSFPLGIRYNAYLSDNSKLFFTPYLNLNYSIGDNGLFNNNGILLKKFVPSGNFSLGLGYAYKNISFETKLYSKMIVIDYPNIDEQNYLTNLSFALKYQLF